MTSRWHFRVGLAILLATAGVHVGGVITPDGSLSATASPAESGWDLPLQAGTQLARAFPSSPCSAQRHRDFDFWVGEWNVFGTNGVFFGTNVVTSELRGCLVQEHWTAANGTRGRSLNAFDRETGLWHQDWVAQVVNPNGFTLRLRTYGGLEDGTMVLAGVRLPTGGFTFLDTWTWDEDDEGNVIQVGRIEVPEFGIDSSFTGVYRRGVPTPIGEQPTPFCEEGQAWGATREADFLPGSYDVSAGPGVPVGEATIDTDLSNCLFVEHFRSRGGLEAVAFTYYDGWVDGWFRIYVDNQGERLALRGAVSDGILILQGTEGTRAGDVEVKLTWSVQGSGLRQVWEVSDDGGSTWRQTATLRYQSH